MRVDDERVGVLDALERPAQLGTDHRRAGVGSVDVEPDAGLSAGLGDRRDWIDGHRGGRADGRDDSACVLEVEQLGPQSEVVVRRDLAQLELEQPARLVDRGVGVRGADDDAMARLVVASGRERGERRGRRRVLDVAVPARRQAEELREPVHDVQLELGRRRRRPPQDPDRVQRRDQELGQDPRLRRRVREVGEEARVLPVRDAGEDDLLDVAQNRRERLRPLGRRRRQLRADLTRRHLCEHGQLGKPFEVRRDPFDGGRSVLAEAHDRRSGGPASSIRCR